MSSRKTILCVYCLTANPADRQTCQACGAPLDRVQQAVQVPVRDYRKPAQKPDPALAVELGKKVEQGSMTALNLYSSFWRALADAAVIAMTAFALGLTGGVTRLAVWGVLLAVLLGLAVGLARKSYLLTLLGAPLGFVGGALVGGVMWAGGMGPGWMVFTAGAGASALAVLGTRWVPLSWRRTWDLVRPFLGAAGGLLFGILGSVLGVGMQAAAGALLK